MTVLRKNGFGMELHAFDRQRLVTQAHDLVDGAVRMFGPSRHFETIGQRRLLHHQRVIARGFERIGQTSKYALAEMAHRRSLAMHDLLGANYLAAERLANGLMA